MKKVLSTKMLDQELIDYATALHLELHMVELITTSPVPFSIDAIKPQHDTIVFTSANAVKFFFQQNELLSQMRGKHIFATSGRTAEALAEYGFEHIVTGKDATELSAKIVKSKSAKSVLHISS